MRRGRSGERGGVVIFIPRLSSLQARRKNLGKKRGDFLRSYELKKLSSASGEGEGKGKQSVQPRTIHIQDDFRGNRVYHKKKGQKKNQPAGNTEREK